MITIIRHDLRKAMRLSVIEYAVLDCVSQQCRSIFMNGWAVIDKKVISQYLDLSETVVWNNIKKLAEFGFIDINESSKQYRVTDLFNSHFNTLSALPPPVPENQNLEPKPEMKLFPDQKKASDKTEYSEKDIEGFAVFNKWIDERAGYIRKMQNQISIDEYVSLRSAGEQNPDFKQKMFQVLISMSNRKDIHKKNVSVYKTLLNWMGYESGRK